jgi:hypothetical protein
VFEHFGRVREDLDTGPDLPNVSSGFEDVYAVAGEEAGYGRANSAKACADDEDLLKRLVNDDEYPSREGWKNTFSFASSGLVFFC